MGITEILTISLVLAFVAIVSIRLIKLANKSLIDGLVKEIDRLYRLNNYHICKQGYEVSNYEKFILDELKSIKNHNCKTYKKTFGKERSFKMTSEKS